MRRLDSGSGTRVAALGIALLVGTVAALAQTTPYDFTGHWTGSATQTGESPVTLVADFMAGTKPKTFTGTLTAGGMDQCTVNGKQKPHKKVTIRLTGCNNGNTIVVHGKLDPTAQTITGHFAFNKKGKVKRGTFMLARGASPSGAFLDDPERSVP